MLLLVVSYSSIIDIGGDISMLQKKFLIIKIALMIDTILALHPFLVLTWGYLMTYDFATCLQVTMDSIAYVLTTLLQYLL